MKRKRDYEEIGNIELSTDEDNRITAMIDQAENDLEETRVSFRWSKEPLELVKRAANVMGVPYQTFIKLVVFGRAVSILKDAQSVTKTANTP